MVRTLSAIVVLGAAIVVGVTLVTGCDRSDRSDSQGSLAGPSSGKPVPPVPMTEQVLGRWRVAADTAGQGLRGTLVLQPDGTFESSMEGGSGTEVASGTCEVTADQGASEEKGLTVVLTVKEFGGKAVSDPVEIQLFYSHTAATLSDRVTVTYVRED